MYEEHFGLKKRPFSVKATGTEVFVGPQTAKTMAGFRKALTVQDAVVTVSGQVGTGKTTLVERALDAIGTKYKTIRVGRMQMNSSDVLESLLVVLGVQDRPAGTIQRFAALRKKLKELQEADTRVFILVEDALRAGVETLAEMEALTVADAGESDGASIVLMGDERLFEFMRAPQLAQLQQRIRQRHKIMPLCFAEMLGYLKHSFRIVGGDFERIFDTRSAELLHVLSDGVPRIANTLVDAVLLAAASEGMGKIAPTFIARIASDEFGLSAEGFDFSIPDPVVDAVSEPLPEAEAVVDVIAEPTAQPEPVVDAIAEPTAQPEPVVDVAQRPQPGVAEESQAEAIFEGDTEKPSENSLDVPHLIQDTLPDLAILSKRYATLLQDDTGENAESVADLEKESTLDVIPELAAEPLPEPEPVTENIPELSLEPTLGSVPELGPVAEIIPELVPEALPEPEATSEAIPELELEPPAETAAEKTREPQPAATVAAQDSVSDKVPEWDRDPTLAQLKPDLEALEQAMAFAHGAPLESTADAPAQAESLADDVGEKVELPEITLDRAIETGIEKHLIEEPADIQAPEPAKKPNVELDRIAANIANAKTLDDVDDIMAETLFGTGISMIAAQLKSMPPGDESANDEIRFAPEPALEIAPVVQEIAVAVDVPEVEEPGEEISIETRPPVANTGLDPSASQRLKTVRALNADLHPSLRETENAPDGNSPAESNEPQPIEDQINTSITQTLKALKVPPELMDDEPEEESKSGFFSRFRRS